jgi:hypothetical protein
MLTRTISESKLSRGFGARGGNGSVNRTKSLNRRKALQYHEEVLELAKNASHGERKRDRAAKRRPNPKRDAVLKRNNRKRLNEDILTEFFVQRDAFMKTGGSSMDSPFQALNGHSSIRRAHDDAFGFDKNGKWVHENAPARVAYLKVTSHPPKYFSNVGALSLFYLDGKNEKGEPIKDISKQPTHAHAEKFQPNELKARLGRQIRIEKRYRKSTGTRLGNGVSRFLDGYRKDPKNDAPTSLNRSQSMGDIPTSTNASSWIVLPKKEIEFIRIDAQRQRLQTLSNKNGGGRGFVHEISALKEQGFEAEKCFNPYAGRTIGRDPALLHSLVHTPIRVKEQKAKRIDPKDKREQRRKRAGSGAFHNDIDFDEEFPKPSTISPRVREGSRQYYGRNFESFVRSKQYPTVLKTDGGKRNPMAPPEQHTQQSGSTGQDVADQAFVQGETMGNANGLQNSNPNWPKTAPQSRGILISTPGFLTNTPKKHHGGTKRTIRWASSDRHALPPTPYVTERTRSRSSNFRMITSRSGFRGARRHRPRVASPPTEEETPDPPYI